MNDYVVTIKGDKKPKDQCRKMTGGYHLIGRDCLFTQGRWKRVGNEMVVYDHELGEHVLKAGQLRKGIVRFEEGVPEFGYFTPNLANNIEVYVGGGVHTALRSEILPANYEEVIKNGIFMTTEAAKQYGKVLKAVDYTGFGYNIEDNVAQLEQVTKSYSDQPLKSERMSRMFAPLLKDTTWGTEVEVVKGVMPSWINNRLGLVLCRDGSVKDTDASGGEIVTIPYQGEKGLLAYKQLFTELRKRTATNHTCSLHIHFGNVLKTTYELVAFYMLCKQIQDEMFQMFPAYKDVANGVKKKSYTQRLQFDLRYNPELYSNNVKLFAKETIKKLFLFYSDGYKMDKTYNRTLADHPTKHKWERPSRYYWINLANMFFQKRRTVEFRLHENTTSFQKASSWFFICLSVIRFTEKYAIRIIRGEKFSLNDVLDYYKNEHPENANMVFLSNYLKVYKNARVALMNRVNKSGNLYYPSDAEDKEFEFCYEGVENLY